MGRDTEHGPRSLLVYNQHQPSSDQRSFPQAQKLEFCKSVIQYAVRYCADEPECVGFVFGGDANLGLASWGTALAEDSVWQLTFEEPRF